jgi:hypothetical protein
MNRDKKQPVTTCADINSAPSVSAVSFSTVASLKASLVPKKYSMVVAYVPDPSSLQALGLVAVRHGQLEYALRMTIKSLTGLDVREALSGTAYVGAKRLRERILKTARAKVVQNSDIENLAELIDRSATVTERRNAVLHGLYAQEVNCQAMLFENDAWRPVPTPDELNALATEIATITQDIHEARLHGFLAKALSLDSRGSDTSQ